MSFEQQDYVQNGEPVQKEETEKEVCRDFKKGDCRRGERCIYHHPNLDVCRDFQFRQCTRQGCRFVHATREEEETYRNSGILPASMNNAQAQVGSGLGNNAVLGKRNYNAMSGVSPMSMNYGQQNSSPMPIPYSQQNSSVPEVCRDFEKGDCRRGNRCKFYHPKLVICKDFRRQKCDRENCRFLHMTHEEEDTYDGNGIVPDHIDKEKLKKNRVMDAPTGGTVGMDEMYGNQRQDNYQTGFSNTAFAAVLQENEALKSKLTEMQQQIMDLRKMNDTLYEQNNNYRNMYA